IHQHEVERLAAPARLHALDGDAAVVRDLEAITGPWLFSELDVQVSVALLACATIPAWPRFPSPPIACNKSQRSSMASRRSCSRSCSALEPPAPRDPIRTTTWQCGSSHTWT